MARILVDLTQQKAKQMTTETKKRGVGPVKASFISNGTASDRPSNPDKVKFTDSVSGKSAVVNLNELTNETLHTLAAQMIEKHVLTYVRNHFDEDAPNADVLVAQRCTEITNGDLNPRAGGAGVPRRVDVSPWVESYEQVYKTLKRPVDAEKAEAFGAKLLSMTSPDRNKYLADLRKKDGRFDAACLKVMADRAKEKTKSIKQEVDLDDLFA